MPVITHGIGGQGHGVGEDIAKILLAKRAQDMEQGRLDLMAKKVEQQMALDEEERARGLRARGAAAQGYEEMFGGSPDQAQMTGADVGGALGAAMGGQGALAGAMSPKAKRGAMQEQEIRRSMGARGKVLSAIAKEDPELAQRFYATTEKEMRERGKAMVRGNLREDLTEALSGGGFNIQHPNGMEDQSASMEAQGYLQSLEDPEADISDIAEKVGALRRGVSEKNLYNTKVRSRLENAQQQLATRAQGGNPADMEEAQALLQGLADGTVEVKDFDKQWGDALNGRLGLKRQTEQLEVENARLKADLIRAQTGATRALETQRLRPPGESGKTDPELARSRLFKNMAAAREEARARLEAGPREPRFLGLGTKAPSPTDQEVEELARQIMGEGSVTTNGQAAQPRSSGRPTEPGDYMIGGQPAQNWDQVREAYGDVPGAAPTTGGGGGGYDTLKGEIAAKKFKTMAELEARAKELGVELKPSKHGGPQLTRPK